MSLLSICNNAMNEMSGFNVPTSFFGSLDLTAKLCVALANREGKSLERDLRWSGLVTEYLITTVANQQTYPLPSDFRAFANMSIWDRTNRWRLTGPISSIVWQWLNSGIVVAASNHAWFMVRGTTLAINPTPTTNGRIIAFDYYSSAWVTKQLDSSFTTEWSSDLDTARLDEDLLTMGLKWRFLQAKGMPFEPEYREYESIKTALQEDSGGRDMINLSGRLPVRPLGGNIPETGYGQS